MFLENGSLIADGQPHTRLLGIYSGRVNDQSDLGIVWTLDAVRDLLRPLVWDVRRNARRFGRLAQA